MQLRIDQLWCLRPGRRSALMGEGDPVFTADEIDDAVRVANETMRQDEGQPRSDWRKVRLDEAISDWGSLCSSVAAECSAYG